MAKTTGNRIVVLIDMDCFFCQVEAKLRPDYAGKPLAVVQYNQWQMGGIIAVNYEARDYGVTRHMRGDEAKEKCPDLILASVPCLRGKSDTTRYRVAGREVIDVIKKHCSIIERASVDEAYMDITDIIDKEIASNPLQPKEIISKLANTFIVGHSEIGKNDEEERRKGLETWVSNIFHELEDVQAQKLAMAGIFVEKLRQDIFNTTGYRCSAGIAQNKILAKLACGLHKPNRQTILPPVAVPALYSTLPVKKVRNLGGKFGDVVVESLNCNVMGDLLQYSLQFLQKRFDEKTGLWLYNIARGIDNEPVTTRLVSKSIGACKKFPGKQSITTLDVLKHWAGEMAAEVCERLEQDLLENQRRATLLTICYHYYQNRATISQSRSCTLTSYKPEKVADRCVEIITKSTQCPIAYFGISVGKFVPAKGSGNFLNFFKPQKVDNTESTDMQMQKEKAKPVPEPTTLGEDFEVDCNDLNVIARNESSLAGIFKTDIKSKLGSEKSIKRTIHDSSKNDWDSKKEDINTKSSTENPISSKLLTTSSTSSTSSTESPTSRRVNKLIETLNERKEKVNDKDVSSNCKTNESLDQEKFKGSFFMSAFTNNENKSDLVAARIYNSEDVESGYESKDSDESNIEKSISDECDSSKEELHEDLCYNAKEESLRLLTENQNNQSSKTHYNNQERICSTSNKYEHESETSNLSSVRLQEIFPDLDNIDPSIVTLLPPDLQEEARRYMKSKTKTTGTVHEASGKGSKGKSSKIKASSSKVKKRNDMYKFLIKPTEVSVSDTPMEQCPQCQQMILVTRRNEHNDFHIAQNLQLELNTIDLMNSGTKRKNASDVDENCAKRRADADICSTSRSSRSITRFFP